MADPDDDAALETFYREVWQRFTTAISVLATRDCDLARRFSAEGDGLKPQCIEIQKQHYARGAPMSASEAEAGTRFIDMLNVLRRISGQLNTIGHAFILEHTRAPDTAVKAGPHLSLSREARRIDPDGFLRR